MWRRGGAADGDVDALEFGRPLVEGHCASAQLGGEGSGALGRAVGDGDLFDAARLEGARGLFAGFAGADDEDFVLGQGGEDLFRKLDGGGHDGDAAALDVGRGADVLGDVEGALEGLVQPGAGVLVREGEFVGVLELAEDLGLADDHGVEAGGDLEEVMQAVGFGQHVNFLIQGTDKGVMIDEKFLQPGKGDLGCERGVGVDLNAVAGGEDGGFAGDAGIAQGLERDGDGFVGKGETFAQFHGRGAVA